MLDAGEVRQARRTSGSDENPFGAVARVPHGYLMSVEHPSLAREHGDPGLAQQVAVNAIETLNFPGFVIPKRVPGKARGRHLEAIALGVLEGFREVGTVDEKLFRHAAHVDTGAPEGAGLHHGHPGAALRRHATGTDAAGARANHQ